MDTYYRLSTGRIVDEFDINRAFEITTGLNRIYNDEIFERWKNRLYDISIEESIQPGNRLIDYCVNNGQMVMAIRIFRDLYGGTLVEAKDAVYKIKEEMNESD